MAAFSKLAALRGSALFRILILLIAVVSMLAMLFSPPELRGVPFLQDMMPPADESGLKVITQPDKIIGLVFYGRKEFVSILDCYLRRNLVDNGGLLDEVIFSVRTDNVEDLKYLDELVATNPRYSKYHTERETNGDNWMGSWEPVQAGNLYIKIDDDVVFFEDHTIEAMVKRMIDNPELFAVSANVVNNPALSWVHYSMGVYEPYFPEMTPPKSVLKNSWRASELPYWTGPQDFEFGKDDKAPYKNHRWLPTRHIDIVRTPAKDLSYDWQGGGLHSWAAAAQTHYSFLSHLEKQDLYKYRFDHWDYMYYRVSINFFGVWGSDIIASWPFPSDDERYLTMERPQQLQRHVVVDGSGIATHFAFGPQRDAHDRHGLFDTDLLTRYRAYAEEMVCPFPHRNSSATSHRPSKSPKGVGR